MKNSIPDIKADILAVVDHAETIDLMEPMALSAGSRFRPELEDLALELAQRSATFRSSLPNGVVSALATLVRAMNCYYSNLIEGHDTHPVDIERALRDDYSAEPRKRNLQLEARAHVEVQRWIDEGGLKGRETTVDGIREIHRRFTDLLPEELRVVTHPKAGAPQRVIAGEFRTAFVEVGNHVAISPGAVPRFMARFEQSYTGLGKTHRILAAAAAHHRLLWIHPFVDGNGRVARLMSYATLLDTLDTGGIWSVARGLARQSAEYKAQLMNCDMPRRNDLAGRGSRSEEALAEFTRFFLMTCLDQVRFMEGLVAPNRLRAWMLMWAEEETRAGVLPAKSGLVLEAILYRGELQRGEVGNILGTGDRQGRRIVSALIERGVLTSASTRAPLRLAFPSALASRWMPGLFPDADA